MPARQVICLVGDGDFLHSLQELAVCVMHTIPVLFVVFNNSGYMSLRDGQNGVFGAIMVANSTFQMANHILHTTQRLRGISGSMPGVWSTLRN